MTVLESVSEDASIAVQNVGGIESTSVTFSPGVTILVGRNASNRTSLLQGVMAALGSDDVTIKGDADEATVELEFDDEMYSRTLDRTNGGLRASGDPYLEDPMLADLFAFLVESNEARRAVAVDQDLRELIMRPVNTDAIQREIDQLTDRRANLANQLDEINSLKGQLPELEEERTHLETQIDEKREELDETEVELESADTDIEAEREEQDEFESALEELREKRSTLDDLRYDVETEEESLEALRHEHRELEDELGELPEAPVGEIEAIDSEIDRLRSEKQVLESDLSDLQSVIQFNEEMLEDTVSDVFAGLGKDGDTKAVTEQLLEDEEVTCWTCGSEVEAEQIEATVDRLRELSRETMGEVTDLESELEDLKTERSTLHDKQQRRDRIERRLTELDNKIEDTEETIESLRERREELTDEIEAVEATVNELEDDSHSEVLDLHKQANQLEYEIGRLESDLDRVTDNIASIENRLAEEDSLETEREQVQDQIEELRTRIERIETQAIEEFNDHMDTVLDLLDYENLDRIWLERFSREVREGRRKVDQSVFELHVVRSTESGTTYEDSVDHLSESERKVTGLVFALAGYLAHEVFETVPFILLDSLEAIDSDRIASLVDYLSEFTGYLLVALLPEDAASLPDEYERITEF